MRRRGRRRPRRAIDADRCRWSPRRQPREPAASSRHGVRGRSHPASFTEAHIPRVLLGLTKHPVRHRNRRFHTLSITPIFPKRGSPAVKRLIRSGVVRRWRRPRPQGGTTAVTRSRGQPWCDCADAEARKSRYDPVAWPPAGTVSRCSRRKPASASATTRCPRFISSKPGPTCARSRKTEEQEAPLARVRPSSPTLRMVSRGGRVQCLRPNRAINT